MANEKNEKVITFVLERFKQHRAQTNTPLFIGLNGVQGIGKTTLVNALSQTLQAPPHSIPNITFSIDDLYLPFQDQNRLASSHALNPLVQHRGQPSTHDVSLGLSVFRALKNKDHNIKIPSYDKSMHNGRGDRTDHSEWKIVNKLASARSSQDEKINNIVEVVIFEGWCVGFRPLTDDEVRAKWRRACEEERRRNERGQPSLGRLGFNREEDVKFVNNALRAYDELTDFLDVFVYLDAKETRYVYDWRLEQESKMRRDKGMGMTDEQVVKFVDGYYPGYELFTDRLRQGVINKHGQQLNLILDKSRNLLESHIV